MEPVTISLLGKTAVVALLARYIDSATLSAAAQTLFGDLVGSALERKGKSAHDPLDEVFDAAKRELDKAAKDVVLSEGERDKLRDALIPLLNEDAFDVAAAVAADYDAPALADALLSKHTRVAEVLPHRSEELRRLTIAAIDGALSCPIHLRAAEAIYRRAVLSGLRNLPRETEDWSRRRRAAAVLRPNAPTPILKGFEAPTRLLSADFAVVPFVGRTEVLTGLHTWMTAADPLAIRLFVGEGGAGKTRLFREICLKAERDGWIAGFVDPRAEAETIADLSLLVGRETPLLLVVDYADMESWAERLQAILQLCRSLVAGGGARVRVALIARLSSEEWWNRLKTRLRDDAASLLEGAAFDRVPFEMPGLDIAARAELFDAAATAFAERLNRPPPSERPDLSAAYFARPLFTQIAALALVKTGRAGAADQLEMLDQVIRWEEAAWEKRLGRDGELAPACAEILAVAQLAGGIREGAVRDLLLRVPLLDGQPAATRTKVADTLRGLYPHEAGGVGAPTPDLIGDRLAAREVGKNTALFDLAPERAGANPADALTVLNRAARDDAAFEAVLQDVMGERLAALAIPACETAIRSGDPIGRLLAERLAEAPNPTLAAALLDVLPWETVALREVAREANQQALTGAADTDDEDARSTRARMLANLAKRLSDEGRREEALEAAREAVVIYQDLAKLSPETFNPDLATSLNNIANFLSDLGRWEEALEAARDAVAIYQDLAKLRPDAFKPDLAMSLNNIASFLSALGRREEALEAAREAVAIYQDLAKLRPDAFKPDLATSLNNIANFLSALGRREEALEAAREAVAIRRDLAKLRPDAFNSNLAMSLNNIASFLSALGRREEALEAAREAVVIRRDLAKLRPDAFKPDLACSLAVLANCLEATDDVDGALEMNREAIVSLAPHFQRLPAAFVHWMGPMIGQYLQRIQNAGREPDMDLLAPLLPHFQQADSASSPP